MGKNVLVMGCPLDSGRTTLKASTWLRLLVEKCFSRMNAVCVGEFSEYDRGFLKGEIRIEPDITVWFDLVAAPEELEVGWAVKAAGATLMGFRSYRKPFRDAVKEAADEILAAAGRVSLVSAAHAAKK